MKIVHVTQPTQAGVAAVVAALAAHQAASGHDVSVLCPVDEIGDGPLRAVSNRGRVQIFDWAAGRGPGLSTIGETHRLGQLLDEIDPTVVVLHSAKAGLAGRLSAHGRWSTVFVPHAWSFEAAEGAIRRASTHWEILAQRWADVTVCVSDDERRRGAAAGVDTTKITVIRNGVDLEHFRPGSRPAARAALGLADVPTVVCVGRLARQKGQDRLLAAWPHVRRVLPDAELVLVGDGPDRAVLEKAAGPSVRFAGHATDPRHWYHAADVVAVPSRWEAGALVPLEAMASGRSVVASDVTGMREALGETGIVVTDGDTPTDHRELGDQLIARLLDNARGAASGDRARADVAKRSSLTDTLRQWDDLLKNMSREITTSPVAHI